MIHPAVTCTKCNFRAPLYDDDNSTVNDLAEHLKVCPGNPYIRALASSRELIADLRKQLNAERRKRMESTIATNPAAEAAIMEDRAKAFGEAQRPSIGRIVHYTNLGDKDGRYPPEVQAALITGVYEQGPIGEGLNFEKEPGAPANQVGAAARSVFADLTIFYRTGEFKMTKVPFALEPKRGHWNWPPRV